MLVFDCIAAVWFAAVGLLLFGLLLFDLLLFDCVVRARWQRAKCQAINQARTEVSQAPIRH